MPAYQFEKNRCWVDLPQVIQNDKLKVNLQDELYYQLTWSRHSKIINPTSIKLSGRHTWLIFKDSLGKLDALVNLLKEKNQEIIIVNYNNDSKNIDINNNYITINSFNESHYAELTSYLIRNKLNISYVIHGWSVTDKNQLPNDDIQHLGFYSLFLLHDKLFANIKERLKLVVVTNGINQVTGNDIIHASKGTMLGAVRVIPHEVQRIKAFIIDVGFDEVIAKEHLLSFITNEENYELEPNFSIRAKYVWKEEIEPITINDRQHIPVIKDHDVILFSGGLGSVSLAIAKEISKHHKVKFILANRREIDNFDENSKSLKLDCLEFIRGNGCEVDVVRCDVSNRKDVEKLINFSRKKYGSINGVIHAAGSPPLDISERNLSNVNDAIRAKVLGAENLLSALEEYSLRFFIMTSSLASLMGEVRGLEYCAANSFLDVLSGMEKDNIEQILAINWLTWEDLGMAKGTNINASTEFNKMENDDLLTLIAKNSVTENEGAEIFYKLINQKDYSHLAVSKLDIMKTKQALFERLYNLDEAVSVSEFKKVLIEEESNDLENEIANIFCQLLGNQKISKHDNYFDLGGNSLSAIKLINRLNKELCANITLPIIFINNTTYKLAKFLQQQFEEDNQSTFSVVDEGEV